MYNIKESILLGYEAVTITHSSTGNYVCMLTAYGAAINGFVVNGKEILVSSVADSTEFDRVIIKSFSGAQLFPFVNRINHARYSLNRNEYRLPANDQSPLPHSLHGLIYNKPFSIVDKQEDAGEITFNYHFKSCEAYPFEFSLYLTVKLDIDTLEITTLIKNQGKEPAPAGYGWHPYIKAKGSINDCLLQLPASTFYKIDESLIPTGETAEFNAFKDLKRINSTDLNYCFEMPANANEHTTTLKDTDGTCIKLIQKGYGYVQYYIPPDRKRIAIEPQTCIADALNNKIGLMWLDPQQEIELSFKIIAEITKA